MSIRNNGLNGQLAVSGAKYSKRVAAEEQPPQRSNNSMRMNGYDLLNSNSTTNSNNRTSTGNYGIQSTGNGLFSAGQPSSASSSSMAMNSKGFTSSVPSSSTASNLTGLPLSSANNGTSGTYTTAMGGGTLMTPSNPANNDPAKYWKQPPPSHGSGYNGGTNSKQDNDIVVIHVCDENQQLSRDFCCKRDILIQHMKYFQKFLSENDGNGYEDIDISVHCDVEIFEWLMTYIHEPESPPKIDKQILVSILISSEFLQMDQLVEHCITQMTQSLNDIIKLPIDLSCISEKLINRIAALTTPKTLSEVRDRKDKILSKLYKRRVELDFSRKGSTVKGTLLGSAGAPASTSTGFSRTIAASLTCCRYCGCVYLENYVGNLICRKSSPSIDFRGHLVSRHAAIPNWSLTSYLKTLHAGGMGWDAIYWHVWAACIVLKVEDVIISALEADRYNVEPDGLLIKRSVIKDSDLDNKEDASAAKIGRKSTTPEFSLATEDDNSGEINAHSNSCKMYVNSVYDESHSYGQQSHHHTSSVPLPALSLNPHRPAEILTTEIFELVCSQMKYIVGLQHKPLVQSTMQSMVDACSVKLTGGINVQEDFYDILWSSAFLGEEENGGGGDAETTTGLSERRRGRSPGRGSRGMSLEPRKSAHSLSKLRASAQNGNNSDGGEGSVDQRSSERRSRSASTGKRPSVTGSGISTAKGNTGVPGTATSNVVPDIELLDDRMSLDPYINRQIEIMRSLPPDLHHRVAISKGPVHGVWMMQSPLMIHPVSLEDTLQSVMESALSDMKKLEWQLDLMREYDEKRIDKFERFLAMKRNSLHDQSLTLTRKAPTIISKTGNVSRGNGRSTTVNPIDYYKDRGRQAYRQVDSKAL